MSLDPDKKYMVCREAKLAKRPILGEVAGSSPATATILVLSFLLLHYLSDFILPSREARQFFTHTFIH